MTVPHQGLICPDCGVAGTYSGNGPHGHRYECPTPDCQTIAYYTDRPPMVFTPAELRRLDFCRYLVAAGRLTEWTRSDA